MVYVKGSIELVNALARMRGMKYGEYVKDRAIGRYKEDEKIPVEYLISNGYLTPQQITE